MGKFIVVVQFKLDTFFEVNEIKLNFIRAVVESKIRN